MHGIHVGESFEDHCIVVEDFLLSKLMNSSNRSIENNVFLLDFSHLIQLVISREYQHQVQQGFQQMIYLHPEKRG